MTFAIAMFKLGEVLTTALANITGGIYFVQRERGFNKEGWNKEQIQRATTTNFKDEINAVRVEQFLTVISFLLTLVDLVAQEQIHNSPSQDGDQEVKYADDVFI